GQTLALADGDRLYLWQLGDSTDTPATLDRIHALEFAFIRDEHTLVVLDLKGNLLLADPVAGLQIPLRSDTASASQPRLAVTDDTAYLLTATGELLRWRDTLPPRGDALRTWLATTAKALELP
ncbi:MAG: hypothetical protein JNK56_31780, partial [Myxococcales bacterium]|nr:hypothetical protein [Myxococcales bacterium]